MAKTSRTTHVFMAAAVSETNGAAMVSFDRYKQVKGTFQLISRDPNHGLQDIRLKHGHEKRLTAALVIGASKAISTIRKETRSGRIHFHLDDPMLVDFIKGRKFEQITELLGDFQPLQDRAHPLFTLMRHLSSDPEKKRFFADLVDEENEQDSERFDEVLIRAHEVLDAQKHAQAGKIRKSDSNKHLKNGGHHREGRDNKQEALTHILNTVAENDDEGRVDSEYEQLAADTVYYASGDDYVNGEFSQKWLGPNL